MKRTTLMKLTALAAAASLISGLVSFAAEPAVSDDAQSELISGAALTTVDHLGREVSLTEAPKTLVSGYYISTSLLIAMGLEDQLTGIEAKADTRPIYAQCAPELLTLPSVGTAKEFDLEGCAALNPDLVIVPAKLKDSIPALEELGLTVLAVKPENQDLLFEMIDMIESLTGEETAGETLKTYISTALSDLEVTLSDSESPSVYFAGNSALLETAGSEMYQNTMIEHAHGTNVAAELTDTYWAEISYEQLLGWNPEYIILAADADYTVESVLEDENLAECTAVKENHVYQIPDTLEALDSPVPGSFLGSIYLAAVLHPELVTIEDYESKADDFYKTFYGLAEDYSSLAAANE